MSDGGYIASADVVEMYGDWIQPSEKVALEKFYKAHTHHEIYKDVEATRTSDLKVFGQGHMLYFYFIKVRICFLLFVNYLLAEKQNDQRMSNITRLGAFLPHACPSKCSTWPLCLESSLFAPD